MVLKMREWIDSQYTVSDDYENGSLGGATYHCREKFGSRKIVSVKCISFPDGHVPSMELSEVSILRHLNHQSVVRLLEAMSCEDGVCLVLEHHERDLHEFIGTEVQFQDKFTQPLMIKGILKEILHAVAYLHSRKVVHCNLEVKNILVDMGKGLTLAGFGLAKSLDPPVSELSLEAVKLVNRAPEIFLGFTNYSYPVDMWAVGCIFAEMVIHRYIFFPDYYFPAIGLTERDVLLQIFRIRGVPTEETWPGVTASLCPLLNEPLLNEQIADYKRELEEVVSLEPAGLDLLSKMLCMNPADRISAEDALNHEYFKA